jgi:cell division protein FtsB
LVKAAKERIASQVRVMEKIANRQKLTEKEARDLATQVKDLMEGRTRLEVPIRDNTTIIFEKDPRQTTIGVKITF